MTDLETLWQRKTDDDLIAAARHWEDYTEECHRVMRAELHRRGLKGFEPATAKEEDKKPDVDALRTESGRRGLSPPAPAAPLEPATPPPAIRTQPEREPSDVSRGAAAPSLKPLKVLSSGLLGAMGTVLALGLLYAISVALRKEGTQGLPPSSTVAGHLFLIGFAAGFPEAVSRYRSKNWPDKLCRESLICAAVCFAVGATAASLLRPVVFGPVADDPVVRFVGGGLIPLALYFAGPIFGGDNARRGESKS